MAATAVIHARTSVPGADRAPTSRATALSLPWLLQLACLRLRTATSRAPRPRSARHGILGGHRRNLAASATADARPRGSALRGLAPTATSSTAKTAATAAQRSRTRPAASQRAPKPGSGKPAGGAGHAHGAVPRRLDSANPSPASLRRTVVSPAIGPLRLASTTAAVDSTQDAPLPDVVDVLRRVPVTRCPSAGRTCHLRNARTRHRAEGSAKLQASISAWLDGRLPGEAADSNPVHRHAVDSGGAGRACRPS